VLPEGLKISHSVTTGSSQGSKEIFSEYELIILISIEAIGLAQDRYRLRALVNSVMNLRVP
jgi:hypothetical protein